MTLLGLQFLDANQPWAPLAYSGVFAGCFIFTGITAGLFHLRHVLLVSETKVAVAHGKSA